MLAEKIEEYELAYSEAANEIPVEQAPMGFMAPGIEIQGSENTSPWMDWKRSSFPSLTGTDNTNWDTADMCMGVVK